MTLKNTKDMSLNLERVIRQNAANHGLVGSEFIVRVQHDLGDEGLIFYIRPQDRDGNTIEFICTGNDLERKDGGYEPTRNSLYNTNVQLSKQLVEVKKERDELRQKLTSVEAILKQSASS